jgi:hypothetical protein
MYNELLTTITAILASNSWKAQNIEVYPSNYQGSIKNKDEYCRISILPSSSNNYNHDGDKELSGLIVFKLFVKAGDGQKRIMELADVLDSYFVNKFFNNGLNLKTSYLSSEGLDPENKTLYSASYFIPFTSYGD